MEKKLFGFWPKTWAELKAVGLSVFKTYWPASNAHPGAVHGDKFAKRPKALHAVSLRAHSFFVAQTNHERNMRSRAAKLHLSFGEYKRKFCA
jgi:hypothetical protein